MCLFEVYINRVVEGSQANEVVENNEVSDILSRIIIPDIDEATVFRFLEGLVRPQTNNKDLRS
jgi:inositol 1,4,5-triphosphate receptor type 1